MFENLRGSKNNTDYTFSYYHKSMNEQTKAQQYSTLQPKNCPAVYEIERVGDHKSRKSKMMNSE